MNDIKIKYFAYASNLSLEHLYALGIDIDNYEVGTLEGYKLIVNIKHDQKAHQGYANILLEENSKVVGLLYTISEDSIDLLDEYEGYPELYFKEYINVTKEDGSTVKALVYIGNPEETSKEELELPEYQKLKIKDGLQHLPIDYANELAAKLKL